MFHCLISQQCAILLVFSGMAHYLGLRMLVKWGTGGLLWGTVQLLGISSAHCLPRSRGLTVSDTDK